MIQLTPMIMINF